MLTIQELVLRPLPPPPLFNVGQVGKAVIYCYFNIDLGGMGVAIPVALRDISRHLMNSSQTGEF